MPNRCFINGFSSGVDLFTGLGDKITIGEGAKSDHGAKRFMFIY